MALTITDQAQILNEELNKLGSPLPAPVAQKGAAGIRQRAREILVEKGIDPFGPTDYRRAVRQAIRESVEGDASLDRVAAVSDLDPKTVRAMVGADRYEAALRAVVARHGTSGLRGPQGVVMARIEEELNRHAPAETPVDGDLHTRAEAILAERGKRVDELEEHELLEVYAELEADDGPSAGQMAIESAATRFDVTARANKILAPLRNVNEAQIVAAVAMAEAEVAGVS